MFCFSKIVPHIRRAWVVGDDRGRRLIDPGEWIVFRSEKVFPKYLRHVLVGDPFHQQFMQTVSGVGGSPCALVLHLWHQFRFPCPAKEQRRIAAISTKPKPSEPNAAPLLSLLDSLTQSLFDMFGDPVTNPEGGASTIGDLAKVQGSVSPVPARTCLSRCFICGSQCTAVCLIFQRSDHSRNASRDTANDPGEKRPVGRRRPRQS